MVKALTGNGSRRRALLGDTTSADMGVVPALGETAIPQAKADAILEKLYGSRIGIYCSGAIT